MMRALRYSLEEAAAALWRGRQSGVLSTATIALALFVLGAFLLVTGTLQRAAGQWGNAAEMSVYLNDDVGVTERAAIEQALAPGPIVSSREYVSKEQALAKFKSTFSDLAAAVDTLGANPIPASYEVRLRTDAAARARLEDLGAELRKTPGVADVRYDRQWLDRLLMIAGVVRAVGLILAAVLTVAAALTVANVVRLGLFARRDEIEIMQLVGAPQAYVRGPFVMEGVLQGGIGALVALAALSFGFIVVRSRYLAALTPAGAADVFRFLPPEVCLGLVAGGMAVGCLGGLVAAWNARA